MRCCLGLRFANKQNHHGWEDYICNATYAQNIYTSEYICTARAEVALGKKEMIRHNIYLKCCRVLL